MQQSDCTMLASKVYESYVLGWALEEVKLKDNQFGGTKGCSASHLLISVWKNILSDLEDRRAATPLTANDYAKVFNRMDFKECLRAFARHGASTDLIKLIATFLHDHVMTVRVGSHWSKKRPVHGGVPQGSILGVLLFNITTDNLEDEHAIGYDPSTSYSLNEHKRSSSEESNDPETTWNESTPQHVGPTQLEPGITPFCKAGRYFVFLESARNVRRAIGYDPDLTQLRDTTLPPEPNHWTDSKWKERPVDKHKYVDNGILDCKLNMDTAIPRQDGGTVVKDKHAVACQNKFRRITRNAELIGMKMNVSKTKQVCVCPTRYPFVPQPTYTLVWVRRLGRTVR